MSKTHGISSDKILLIEAQDYVGGRIKQTVDFVPGCKIDLGAEFIHGDNSMLNEFASETNQPLQSLFCWAHGDGNFFLIKQNRSSNEYLFVKLKAARPKHLLVMVMGSTLYLEMKTSGVACCGLMTNHLISRR